MSLNLSNMPFEFMSIGVHLWLWGLISLHRPPIELH